MLFLRKRKDNVERGHMNEKFTSEEKAHAYFVLEGQVLALRHPYDRCRWSGSGNCWCGHHKSHSIHGIVIDESHGKHVM